MRSWSSKLNFFYMWLIVTQTHCDKFITIQRKFYGSISCFLKNNFGNSRKLIKSDKNYIKSINSIIKISLNRIKLFTMCLCDN